jgi:hypothetical protein
VVTQGPIEKGRFGNVMVTWHSGWAGAPARPSWPLHVRVSHSRPHRLKVARRGSGARPSGPVPVGSAPVQRRDRKSVGPPNLECSRRSASTLECTEKSLPGPAHPPSLPYPPFHMHQCARAFADSYCHMHMHDSDANTGLGHAAAYPSQG